MKKVKKPVSNADRTRNSVQKYKDAGLIQAKVWVHPDEAAAVRVYAAKKPKTKTVLKKLKS